jgi:hypothetical protein
MVSTFFLQRFGGYRSDLRIQYIYIAFCIYPSIYMFRVHAEMTPVRGIKA